MDELPDEAYAATLAGLSHMHLRRLASLLRHHTPSEAFAVAAGQAPAKGPIIGALAEPAVAATWRREATTDRARRVWDRCIALGLQVLLYGGDRYPRVLVDDPLPAPVLFARGSLDLLGGRRVGIVGTRNATAAGRTSATGLGAALAEAGVHVVSGLARGIDGCAHRGVLRSGGHGRPIGVVASGLDVVYPREHHELWERTATSGLLLSEAAPGVGPDAYRFPLRNRLIAALSEVVVVVESRERGGSLITVDEAIHRGVPVMALPGGTASPASAGTNALLRDGAGVVTGLDDVLAMLHLSNGRVGATVSDSRRRPARGDLAAYEACAGAPRTVDGLAMALDIPLVEAAMTLARLEQGGWVVQADGWYEPTGSPLR